MSVNRYPNKQFSIEDIEAMKPAMKVGLLATVTPQGYPHLTLISTLMAASAGQVVWGQFMEGRSKEHVGQNGKTAFLVMTLDKMMWRGKADYSHAQRQGTDYDFYNNTPMFRYNSYFGVHTVHYMDLICHSGKQILPMVGVVASAVSTLAARKVFAGRRDAKLVMNNWTRVFIDKIDNLKFISWVAQDGYPVIVPVIQAQTLDDEHILFSNSIYREELAEMPEGGRVVLFDMAMSMEDVLVGGIYQGVRRFGVFPCGVVQVDWVYNAMPPVPMQIYPEMTLTPVKDF